MYNDSDPDTDCYCIVQNNTKTEVESEARIEYKLGQRKFTNKLTRDLFKISKFSVIQNSSEIFGGSGNLIPRTRNREVRFCENFDRKFVFKQIIIELYDINEKSAYWKKRFVHPSLFPSSFTNHEMAQSSSDDDFIYHYDNNNKPDSSIDRHATVPSKVRLTFCKSKMGKIMVIYWPFFDILIS